MVLKERIEAIEAALKNGALFEKASIAGMLEQIGKIMVYPTYLEIFFNIASYLGMDKDVLPGNEMSSIRIDYGNRFN